jgi:hypothetical protein
VSFPFLSAQGLEELFSSNFWYVFSFKFWRIHRPAFSASFGFAESIGRWAALLSPHIITVLSLNGLRYSVADFSFKFTAAVIILTFHPVFICIHP